ncbi:MAG: hypothetical protein ACLRRU_12160 [Faecalibacterium sp.]
MTDTKLRELLVVIDDHYGRARSLEERRADTQIYIRAFGTIPDEIVEKALYTAFTQCRFQNQLIVDWCAEIKNCCVSPAALGERPLGAGLRQLPGKSRQICTTRPTVDSLPPMGAS